MIEGAANGISHISQLQILGVLPSNLMALS